MTSRPKHLKLNPVQARQLVGNLRRAQAAETLGLVRLAACFPDLAQRLATARETTHGGTMGESLPVKCAFKQTRRMDQV